SAGTPCGMRDLAGGTAALAVALLAHATNLVPLTEIDGTFFEQSGRGKTSSPSAGVPAEWGGSCPTTFPFPTPWRPRPSPAPPGRQTARFRAASTPCPSPRRQLARARFRAASTSTMSPQHPLPGYQSCARRARLSLVYVSRGRPGNPGPWVVGVLA